jgi:hypothetical protein
MNQQGPDTRIVRDSYRTINGILQQSCTQVYALSTAIDGKSAQHHYRHRIRHVVSHRTCCPLVRNGSSSHGVVTADSVFLISHYKRATSTAQLVG